MVTTQDFYVGMISKIVHYLLVRGCMLPKLEQFSTSLAFLGAQNWIGWAAEITGQLLPVFLYVEHALPFLHGAPDFDKALF